MVVGSVTASVFPASALAMDIGLRCQAPPDAVFDAATKTVREMRDWRSVRIVSQQRTIKGVVRNWRSFVVPLWIQIRPRRLASGAQGSELHILWEQRMAPLSYPEVFVFMEAFGAWQKSRGLDCRATGTDIGL